MWSKCIGHETVDAIVCVATLVLSGQLDSETFMHSILRWSQEAGTCANLPMVWDDSNAFLEALHQVMLLHDLQAEASS